MRVIIEPDYQALSNWAANYVADKINAAQPTAEKPFVLGLPTGSSPLGMYKALIELNKPFDETLSILKDNSFTYGSIAAAENFYSSLPQLPDVIVCANDFIALAVVDALKQCRRANLQKINVVGFDNVPESRLHSPKLSTVNIDKQALGKQAVAALLERIQSPRRPRRLIYLKNNFVVRETTPFLGKN